MTDTTLTQSLPNPQLERYSFLAKWGHWVTLFCYCTLLLLFSVNQWLRPEGISLFQWTVQCGPLLLVWLGLRRQRRRSYLWLCCVILLYFIKGVEGVMSPSPEIFDAILTAASVGIFVAGMMTMRWLRLKALLEQTPQPG